MNKPVSPGTAQDRGAPTDTPEDLHRDEGSPTRVGGEPDAQNGAGDAEGSGPRHDILDVRGAEPNAKTDRSRTGRVAETSPEGRNREDAGRNPDDDRAGKADPAPEARSKTETPDHEDRETPDGAPAEGDERAKDEPPPEAPPKIVFIAVAAVLLLCLAWGGYSHWRSYHEAQQTTDQTLNRPVDVRTVVAQREDGPMTMTLPGETDAFDTANIYPRATGYIGERRVDIGTRVKQGDLLLRIAAPDLDKQLAQAVAQLGQTQAALRQANAQVAQAEANVNLAKVTFARTNQLTQQGFESLQNRDNQQANVQTQQANVEAAKAGVTVAEANIKAQEATVDRLRALVAFEEVRAPFDGVITSRSVDVGDLVNADSSTGTPMFTMARDTVVRVTVRVPQNAATGILDGLEATVHVPQMPDHPFKGRVARTSGALLYSSRSLTTEVDVPNPDGQLRSGLYVTVDFQIPRQHPNVTVPAEALIFNQLGLQVASVDDNKAKMHSVTIFRDHGTSLELRDGLEGGEHVILSPPATLADGGAVKETREDDQKKDDGKKDDAKGK